MPGHPFRFGAWGKSAAPIRNNLAVQDVPDWRILESQWRDILRSNQRSPGRRLLCAVLENALLTLRRCRTGSAEFKEAWKWFRPGFDAKISLDDVCQELDWDAGAVRNAMRTPALAKKAALRLPADYGTRHLLPCRRRCAVCREVLVRTAHELAKHETECRRRKRNAEVNQCPTWDA